ncbi:MAG: diacylglycerol kinase family protein [Pyrinomonadaceae bacterium]
MSSPLRTLVILNNKAARAKRTWPLIRKVLARHNFSFDLHETTHAGDAESCTRSALGAGYSVIAVVGGDGTLSEVASGFFEPQDGQKSASMPASISETAALALLPSGTGNDFARGLLRRRASLDDWINKLIEYSRNGAAAQRIDVLQGSVDGGAKKFICLNAATLGIGAEVAALVAGQSHLTQRFSGEIRFAMAALAALARWRVRRVRVRVDDQAPLDTASNLIAISNGLYAGGGMKFTPAARFNDGRLDVLVVQRGTRRTILRELTRIHSGGHLANPKVLVKSGTRVRIDTPHEDQRLTLEADGNVADKRQPSSPCCRGG